MEHLKRFSLNSLWDQAAKGQGPQGQGWHAHVPVSSPFLSPACRRSRVLTAWLRLEWRTAFTLQDLPHPLRLCYFDNKQPWGGITTIYIYLYIFNGFHQHRSQGSFVVWTVSLDWIRLWTYCVAGAAWPQFQKFRAFFFSDECSHCSGSRSDAHEECFV